MTIPEAVNLVLAGGAGRLWRAVVLEMGEPVRIADLARHMITLSGRVPGNDIPIVYTGLRPGEKLHEEVLTEEEERTHAVRKRIRVTASPPPPPDLAVRLATLRRAAEAGDRAAILEALRGLVPSYRAPLLPAGAITPPPFRGPPRRCWPATRSRPRSSRPRGTARCGRCRRRPCRPTRSPRRGPNEPARRPGRARAAEMVFTVKCLSQDGSR